MPCVSLNLPHHSYEVLIEPGALSRLGELLQKLNGADPKGRCCGLIVDEAVAQTHGKAAAQVLKQTGYDLTSLVMPGGEQNKSLATVEKLLNGLLDGHLDRKSVVVALGGGITTDVGGFVAASYMRGIDLVQCPTTLLAMVDASVGGKTGVNMPQGKNLVGAFYQPKLVVIDPKVLATLPRRELCCGLAECIKHGMIKDSALLEWTVQNSASILDADQSAVAELVGRNVQIKADVVMEDEKEQGQRAILNFGHTFAHAIEAACEYGKKYEHGEAVALGMMASTRLAIDSGRCGQEVLDKLLEALTAAGLPTVAADLPDDDTLLKIMQTDKKTIGGKLKFILPLQIGAVEIADDISQEQIRNALSALRR